MAFGALVAILFTVMGGFLIDAKSRELVNDISAAARSYAEVTARKVVEANGRFLVIKQFWPFQRLIDSLVADSQEISGVRLVSYDGTILYNSVTDRDEATYRVSERPLAPVDDMDRVESNNTSILLRNGRAVYVQVGEDGNSYQYMDFYENPIEGMSRRDKIVDIAVPYNDEFTVFFDVDYSLADERIAESRTQIVLVSLAGLVLTLIVSFGLSVTITRPLERLKAGASKIAAGNFDARVKVKSKDEIGALGETFNKMAEGLAASTEAKMYRERVGKELEIAANIQTDLLPKDEVTLKTLDISGGLIPASEIGGDAFDYIGMDDGRYLAYLGDVTGHGVPAGIVSSIANALLYAVRDEVDLKKIIRRLNDVILAKTPANVFMTIALALWDESKDTVYYVNAGHPPVLYYDSSTQTVSQIRLPGMALGLSKELEEKTQMYKIHMKPNDAIVMYSDGIPDAVNVAGEQYGMERLKAIVESAAKDLYTAKGIKNSVLADVVEHINKFSYADDMTVVVLKRKSV